MRTRRRRPRAAPACLFGLLAAAGCLAEGSQTQSGLPGGGGKADGLGDCAYEVDFDKSDPNDYLWTVKVAEVWTLPVFLGRAEVHFRRFAAGVDPTEGDPVQTGRIQTERRVIGPGSGSLWSETVLAHEISYRDLVDGSFRFLTLRSSDRFAMTSCVKRIEISDAVASHNQILEHGYPRFDPMDYTDPSRYRDEQVATQPGVVMMVDSDCDIPDPTNTGESRSVLSWLAVTLEATPNPVLIDPFIEQGIDFERGPDEGTYCQDSPWDWSWKIAAYGAKTQVGNQRDLPGDRGVKLDINGRFWQDGLEATNVQVDPEDGDLNAERGQVLTDFGGEEVTTLELDALLDDQGIQFRIRRDDFGGDLSYAECRGTLDLSQVQTAHEDRDHRIRLVKTRDQGAPASHVEVTECTDGWFNDLGLHYLDLGIEAAERIADHPEPPRPDLSEIEAGGDLRELPPE